MIKMLFYPILGIPLMKVKNGKHRIKCVLWNITVLNSPLVVMTTPPARNTVFVFIIEMG